MKTYILFIIVLTLFTLNGCNQFKSDHPQTKLSDPHQTTDANAENILEYQKDVENNIKSAQAQQSLVYMLGDLSFYVESYGDNILIEHAYNGGESTSLKKYYFRNDSLLLYQTRSELASDDNTVFKDERVYMRNHTVFRIDGRMAASESTVEELPFIDIPLSQNPNPDKNYLDNVTVLRDVLRGENKFEMLFESIRTFPDARYITLRSREQNGYTASILVKERDAFIDSLLNYPNLFKDKRLQINWEIKDREAVYLPK
ncbi:MAG: hypothetical protein EOO90_14820 [Pedobacter sp.]|nr:MAG: hypothetical protein EOO90_14820 [Pedobacter sp.]